MTPAQKQQYWDVGMMTMELIRAAFYHRRPQLPEDTDWDLLLRFCHFHGVGAMAAMGLEGCMELLPPEQAEAWLQEKNKSIRRSMLFNAERQAVSEYLTQIGCRHVLLKGSILQTKYPRIGMRWMNDTDILVDGSFRDTIRAWMEERGYAVRLYGENNVDVYQKAPVYHFEIHTALFGGYRDAELARYYQKLERQLLESAGPMERQMNREDFFIYLIAHAYRHMNRRGIGIRNLVDLYVFCHNWGVPDAAYTRQELEKLGMWEFADSCVSISMKLMEEHSDRPLTDSEKDLLLEFFTSGTFGTGEQVMQRLVQNGEQTVTRKKRIAYVLRRMFPHHEAMAKDYPVLKRHPWLLPWYWLRRLLKGLTGEWKKILAELRSLGKIH